MLFQAHWLYEDGTTEVKAQKDIKSAAEMEVFIDEIIMDNPLLPPGAKWTFYNEKSEHFVSDYIQET